jgi:hypothetical protein
MAVPSGVVTSCRYAPYIAAPASASHTSDVKPVTPRLARLRRVRCPRAARRPRLAADVVCLESFPDSVRSFRVRHVKWTRGTCEFLRRYLWRLVRSRCMSRTEKLDILFPTLNLPLTVFFFGFVLVTSIALPLVGALRTR